MSRFDLSSVPAEALEERHLSGTGPGGQNANKVASIVQLRVDVRKLSLAPSVFRRLKQLAGTRMTANGMLVITARSHRTQESNRRDAFSRLNRLLRKAHVKPVRRIKTKPSRAAKARRVDNKKLRGQVKQTRSKPSLD